MGYKTKIVSEDAAARDGRCGSDRRVDNQLIVHPERRLRERRNTPLQAFLWASSRHRLRA
jgi:hypothetical protein